MSDRIKFRRSLNPSQRSKLNQGDKMKVHSIAKKAQMALIEKKFHRANATDATLSTTAVVIDLTAIPQGTSTQTDQVRHGDKVSLVSCRVNYSLKPGATSNNARFRVILFQWTDQDSPTEPSITEVRLVATSILMNYNHDNLAGNKNRRLKILADKRHQACSSSTGQGVPVALGSMSASKKLRKNVQYTGGGIYGNNKIFLCIVEEHQGTSEPQYSYDSVVTFTDA